MTDIKTKKAVSIIGGDRRQVYLKEMLERDGMQVYASGLGSAGCGGLSPAESAKRSDIIILPIPSIKQGALFAPLEKDKIILNSDFAEAVQGKTVICGGAERLSGLLDGYGVRLTDILEREDFAVLNSALTVEGALLCAIESSAYSIIGSRCLICGFGRIGKLLSRALNHLGGDITVTVRKAYDAAWAEALGYKYIYAGELEDCEGYRLIFNTIPALYLTDARLKNTDKDAVVIDLASYPGGVDFEYCGKNGIRAQHALSLPGKYSPAAAAEIIKKTIYKIMEEEKLE